MFKVWIYLYGQKIEDLISKLGTPDLVEEVDEEGIDFSSILEYDFKSQEKADNFMSGIPAGVDFDYA